MKRDEVYYQAMLARDVRFDGKFFVGVKTTGIYCRPICPARPKRENIEFFSNRLEAERAGYRPCLRCRPESAPRSPAWIGKSSVVQRAVKMLHHHDVLEFNEDKFADKFGITARHLRRLFQEEIGKTPKQLAFANRLNLARQLLAESDMPVSQVVFASGFNSIRRFNDAFKDRFKRNPSQIRRTKTRGDGLTLALPYRPPYDFASVLRFYRNHSLGQLESYTDTTFSRLVHFKNQTGRIEVANDEPHSRLLLTIEHPNPEFVHTAVSRVREMFDLNSDPILIANALETDAKVKILLKKFPGVRLPSGWDPFETAVGTILGQLVSVERGRALVNDLIEMIGEEIEYAGQRIKLFPTPQALAAANLTALKSTGARKETLKRFAQALLDGTISLDPTQDVEEFSKSIMALKGIGKWTADYMALRVLRHTDAFPETDLILARVLKSHHPKHTLEKLRPWRGYAAALFWREYAEQLTRRKK